MILKRKKAKPVDVGTICKIKDSVKDKMMQEYDYNINSVSQHAEGKLGYITRRDLRKNSKYPNKIMLADAELIFVGSNSIFGDDIVEAIPLKIKKDRYGYGIKNLLTNNPRFFMRKDSLCLANQQEIAKFDEDHHSSIKTFIENTIIKLGYTNFSW